MNMGRSAEGGKSAPSVWGVEMRSQSLGLILAAACSVVVGAAYAQPEAAVETPQPLPSVDMVEDVSLQWDPDSLEATDNDGLLYGGAEIIFFKPFGEAGTTPQQAIAASGASSFLPAWRLWGGWSDEEGLGARVRWWQYDQFSSATDSLGTSETRLIFQKLDVEVTQ